MTSWDVDIVDVFVSGRGTQEEVWAGGRRSSDLLRRGLFDVTGSPVVYMGGGSRMSSRGG